MPRLADNNANKIMKVAIALGIIQLKKGEVIAVLDSRDRSLAALNQAQGQVKIAEANLAKIKAGAKTGEIQAPQAAIARIETESRSCGYILKKLLKV